MGNQPNHHALLGRPAKDEHHQSTTDSAVGSSEDEAIRRRRRSTSADSEAAAIDRKQARRRGRGRRGLQYSRTVTERDVRHLDRHLSMKKTIRKKIMRALQQAFVDDPPRLLDHKDQVSLDDVLKFEPPRGDEQRLLDLLRDSDDSGHGSSASPPPPSEPKHKQFRSVRERPRKYPGFFNDTSSCEDGQEVILHSQYLPPTPRSVREEVMRAEAPPEDEIIVATEQIVICDEDDHQHQAKAKKKRRSFWEILIGKKKK